MTQWAASCTISFEAALLGRYHLVSLHVYRCMRRSTRVCFVQCGSARVWCLTEIKSLLCNSLYSTIYAQARMHGQRADDASGVSGVCSLPRGEANGVSIVQRGAAPRPVPSGPAQGVALTPRQTIASGGAQMVSRSSRGSPLTTIISADKPSASVPQVEESPRAEAAPDVAARNASA